MAAMTPDAAEIEEVDARFCRALEGRDICRIAGGARRIAAGATRTLGGRFELRLLQRCRPVRSRAPSDLA